jgi:transcriptional regulator with XRE-family HTH domain
MELASRMNISASYLSLVEGDKREPSIPLLRRLAGELGAPAVLLFATALAGSNEIPTNAEFATVLEKLVGAVGISNTQAQLVF